MNNDSKEEAVPAATTQKKIMMSWATGSRYDQFIDVGYYRGPREDVTVEKILAEIATGKHGPMVKLDTPHEGDKWVPLAQICLYVTEIN